MLRSVVVVTAVLLTYSHIAQSAPVDYSSTLEDDWLENTADTAFKPSTKKAPPPPVAKPTASKADTASKPSTKTTPPPPVEKPTASKADAAAKPSAPAPPQTPATIVESKAGKYFKSGQGFSKSAGVTAHLDVAGNTVVDLAGGKDEHSGHVDLLFTMFNPTKEPKRVLKWATPLDTLEHHKPAGPVFVVHTAAGDRLEYEGPDTKRRVHADGTPPADSFVTIPPSGKITGRINIAEDYDWPEDGWYYVRIKNTMMDARKHSEGHTYLDVMHTQVKVYIKNTAVEHKRKQEALIENQRRVANLIQSRDEAGARYTYDGCSSSQEKEIEKWVDDAKVQIKSAKQCRESGSCSALVDTWFGSTSQANFAQEVTQMYETMSSKIDNSVWVCDLQRGCAGEKGRKSTFGYVNARDQTQRVNLCPFAFTAAQSDYGEAVQTVVHELSHFDHIGGTDDDVPGWDDVYGEVDCKDLANQYPEEAVDNADNIGYFAKYQPGGYRNAPAGYDVNCVDQRNDCADLGRSLSANCDVCCATCKAQKIDPDCYDRNDWCARETKASLQGSSNNCRACAKTCGTCTSKYDTGGSPTPPSSSSSSSRRPSPTPPSSPSPPTPTWGGSSSYGSPPSPPSYGSSSCNCVVTMKKDGAATKTITATSAVQSESNLGDVKVDKLVAAGSSCVKVEIEDDDSSRNRDDETWNVGSAGGTKTLSNDLEDDIKSLKITTNC